MGEEIHQILNTVLMSTIRTFLPLKQDMTAGQVAALQEIARRLDKRSYQLQKKTHLYDNIEKGAIEGDSGSDRGTAAHD